MSSSTSKRLRDVVVGGASTKAAGVVATNDAKRPRPNSENRRPASPRGSHPSTNGGASSSAAAALPGGAAAAAALASLSTGGAGADKDKVHVDRKGRERAYRREIGEVEQYDKSKG